jgi:hypothetical protein
MVSMTERQAPPRVDRLAQEATLVDGQVRVHLPFAVDPHALSAQLLREGYPLAHEPNTPDTQGWGNDFDSNGYYPYWVYPDPERPDRSVFAFNPRPEDVISRGSAETTERLALGERSRALIQRWVPVLGTLTRPDETAH